MKSLKILPALLVVCFALPMMAQGSYHHDGNYDPDSLELVTLTGTAIVDTQSTFHPIYFLDTDNNGTADYHLNFGPYWYEPDSSNDVRPNNGDEVTVYGGLHESMMTDYDVIVVYEINGEFWREPYEPLWNYVDGHRHGGGHHNGDCNSYGFDWNHDSLKTVTLTGTTLVDSTFIIEHYYLDVNNDSIPEYMLNFGPPWYEPESGVVRPANGDEITVTGGLAEMPNFDMVVVYELNGEVWRDSTELGFNFGGGWMHSNIGQPVQFHSPYDDEDNITVHPGWRRGGGMQGGGMMPDSVYAQMLELFPGNLPNIDNEHAFAGYQFNMFLPGNQPGMGSGSGCGGMMQFNNDIDFQLHYNNSQLNSYGINENNIAVKYYDSASESWVEINNADINTANQIITFSSEDVPNFVIITGEPKVTAVDDEDNIVVESFSLKQNYPNPFNPTTNIEFGINENSHVILSVYDALGQEVAELINAELGAGVYTVTFNADNLSSGIYFYKLRAGAQSDIKKMQLLR